MSESADTHCLRRRWMSFGRLKSVSYLGDNSRVLKEVFDSSEYFVVKLHQLLEQVGTPVILW